MEIAVKEAFEGMRRNEGGPFGAVITKGGALLARTHNSVLHTNDPTAHAEILAIRQASLKLGRFDLSDCEIYSTCEPCPMCLASILWARIPVLYYGCTKDDAENIGFDDQKFYNVIEIKDAPSLLKKIQVNRDECLAPFKEWQEKTDKTIY